MEIVAIVTPGARKERIERVDAQRYCISVREAAERNQANVRVRTIIADMHSLPVSRVQMLRGARSQKKVFKIIR